MELDVDGLLKELDDQANRFEAEMQRFRGEMIDKINKARENLVLEKLTLVMRRLDSIEGRLPPTKDEEE